MRLLCSILVWIALLRSDPQFLQVESEGICRHHHIFILSGSTVLRWLLSSVWKQLFYKFCSVFSLFMKGRIIHNSYSVVVRCPSFPSCSCDIDSLEETRPVVLQNAPYFGFVWLFYHDQIQVKHFWQEFYIWNIVSVLILILFHWSLSVLCYAVPHCLDYSSFIGFEIGKFEPFNFVLFQDYPEYSGSFEFPYEF